MKRFVFGVLVCLGAMSVAGAKPTKGEKDSQVNDAKSSNENKKLSKRPEKDSESSLNILLINDQGNTHSFQILRAALLDAGHNVKAFIPSGPVGSFGSAFTSRGLTVTKTGTNVWTVSNASIIDTSAGNRPLPGTPVECLEVGLKQFDEKIDLVVSGFNDATFSAGSFIHFSGGTGAAMASTIVSQAVNISIPSISVSISGNPSEKRIENAADFIVNLVGRLAKLRRNDDSLLPHFTSLAVNVPGSGPIAGVSMGRIGLRSGPAQAKEFLVGATQNSAKLPVVSTGIITSELDDIPFSDTDDREDGWVTIVPIHTDITAPVSIVHAVSKMLKDEILTERDTDEDLSENLVALTKPRKF